MSMERFEMEQRMFPQMLFGDELQRLALLQGLLESKGAAVRMLMETTYRSHGKPSPYQDDEFSVKVKKVAAEGDIQEFCVVIIDMPVPEEPIYASRIFVCFDADSFNKPGYFFVRKSDLYKFSLGGRNQHGEYCNYGKVQDDENVQFQKVCDFYLAYWLPLPLI
ncbi:hypothetical protein J6U78_07500 [bacterium]|nr:hypothetical protein [bacterium]